MYLPQLPVAARKGVWANPLLLKNLHSCSRPMQAHIGGAPADAQSHSLFATARIRGPDLRRSKQMSPVRKRLPGAAVNDLKPSPFATARIRGCPNRSDAFGCARKYCKPRTHCRGPRTWRFRWTFKLWTARHAYLQSVGLRLGRARIVFEKIRRQSEAHRFSGNESGPFWNGANGCSIR